MKRTYRLEELDCVACAMKMEDAVRKLEGVSNVRINFLLGKMTLEADDANFDDIMKKVRKLCHRLEPDCKIV